MKISVIGTGGIARKYYLPHLSSQPEVQLQCISRSPEKNKILVNQYRVDAVGETMEDVYHWNPDAVFVLTPSPSHYALVKNCLEHDLDVFVEKPATTEASQTHALAALADKRNRVLMIGFNRRYAPLHRRAKEYWGNRRVEQAIFIKFRNQPFHQSARDHLYDDTIHLIDALRFFCGDGQVVHREVRMDGSFIGGTAVIALEAGGIAQVITSMRAGQWKEEYLWAGDGLTMHLNAFQDLTISQGDEQRTWNEMYDAGSDTPTGRGFIPEIDHFLECVQYRRLPLSDAHDSYRTQLLVEAFAGED